ncbi:class I SAM-dependent methyltransferase [Micromonospora sp. NPDC007271]|uniref:class I SAM-dependent methyltransferase n=1 Tax=Micromonospora sp. NPDC007271 TaxID=3154587 RepID=UPI0033DFDF25
MHEPRGTTASVAALPGLPPGVGAAGSLSARLFNDSIGGFAVAAADELGLLDAIAEHGTVDREAYAQEHDLHPPSLRAVTDALASAGVVAVAGDKVTGTTSFADVHATKGFFTWLLGGCGELLRTAGAVGRTANRHGRFIQRDATRISIGTADFGARFIDPVFDAMLDRDPPTRMVDVGCGSGSRLISALRRHPHATAIGIDVAPAAVALARARLVDAGLADRAIVIEADVHDLEHRPEFADVDFVCSFLMGHDFWPRERCVRVLDNLRRAFPALRSFALCDTYRSGRVPGTDLPILTLGFEHVHALMGQDLPTLDQWYEVFDETGWRVRHEYDLVLPPHSKIFHLTPDRGGDRR